METKFKIENPLVSVIIPTYNGEEYLGLALDSVLHQTYKTIEVVVVDDGSTDGTEAMILKYREKDSRIIHLKNENNVGFVKSLNRGVASAHGKYIARLDDDDVWIDTCKIEKQVIFLEKNPEYVLVGGGLIRVNSNRKEMIRYLFPQKDEEIRKAILVDNIFAHSTVVFKKEAFSQVGGYDEQFGFFADRELWLKLGRIGKFYNFPEYFIYYLDKEDDASNYNSRNNHIRRKLKLNITLRKNYRYDYSGFYKSLMLCVASYIYSYLPYRQKFRWVLFKIRVFIFGNPPYTYFDNHEL